MRMALDRSTVELPPQLKLAGNFRRSSSTTDKWKPWPQLTTKHAMKQKGALLRILGVSFGVAVTLGSTIGIGILRTPGTVAAQLGTAWLVMAIWTVGGIYALFGTLTVAELATTLPQ